MDETIGIVSVADLGRGPAGGPVFVSLDHKAHGWEVDAAMARVAADPTVLTIGVARRVVAPGLDRLAEVLTCTVGDGAPSSATAVVPDLDDTLRTIAATVARAPRAALALDGLLRATERSSVRAGLGAESAARAELRRGDEFARLRADSRTTHGGDGPAVVVDRHDHRLIIELNRPAQDNAYTDDVRDGLVDALDRAVDDRTITQVVVRGRGDSFCRGGDSGPSETLERSAGLRLDRLRARVTVEVHGACVGAGAGLPGFAGRVVARRDTWFQLPELSTGLVPGAGGTVSITRRIGRPRTAFLALSGARIDAATAVSWGLVDSLR